MDIKELRGLMEAYQQVNAPQKVDEGMHRDAKTGEVVDKAVPGKTYYPAQPLKKSSVAIEKEKKMKEEYVDEATAMAKRGYDEAPIRQKIAKSTGGGQAADRATKLADKSTFGDAKKAKQRQELARKQRGDFRKTTSSSPGLHGYGHKSNDPKVQAKQAARGAQRGALTPAEKKQLNREEFDIFDVVLEFLQVNGYAETLEEAEWMMANLLDKEAIDIIVEAMHEDEEEDEEDEKKMKKRKEE